MTTYGTIPTSSASSPPANLEYISRAKERIKSGLAERRPWKLMLNVRALRLPTGFPDALSRVRTNLSFFRTNYAMVFLLILFLSLLWHPISLIVFVVMMAAWLFLYFLRDEPLAVFGRTIDDRVVLAVMSVLTLVFLLLTHATVNILVAVLIGAVVVVLHAAMRRTDDLSAEGGEAAGTRGLMTSVGSPSSS
ncbi:PRA1 family protein F2-like [Syzygium oleosum]|uniref:PRA1 family protein F2-like n=1 Tax=Syzygium oleosum TaxID=219896 RepID=UPI0011D2279B|nr:PRA1 family protein F2-like [Syzygium oleosum]